jgi:hypothetical protein
MFHSLKVAQPNQGLVKCSFSLFFGIKNFAKFDKKISKISQIYILKSKNSNFFPNFFFQKWEKNGRKKKT